MLELYNDHMERILFTQEDIAKRVAELGQVISKDYIGKEVVLVAVLRGSFIFAADLCRQLEFPCSIEFMSVSSYGSGTSSTGQVQITKDLSCDIAGKHIIVLEDILDSGNTLSYLFNVLRQRKPASLELCTLLNNPTRRQKDVEVAYCGFEIPNEFVVGYGLDFAQQYRTLPYIGILKKSFQKS